MPRLRRPPVVIARRIGFFGLQETYSTHCRDCLPKAASELGWDPEKALETHDQLAKGVEDARDEYQKRQRDRHNGKDNTDTQETAG